MTYEERIKKLKNGSDTEVWAAKEILRLRNGLEELLSVAESCDSWESFPSKSLDSAHQILNAAPIEQSPDECGVRPLVVVQTVWVQVSADYDAVARTRTIAVTQETTIGEVMRWAAAGNALGRGDVVLTEQEHLD